MGNKLISKLKMSFYNIETWMMRAAIIYVNYHCIDWIQVLPAYFGMGDYFHYMMAGFLVSIFLLVEVIFYCILFLCLYNYALIEDRVIMGDILG